MVSAEGACAACGRHLPLDVSKPHGRPSVGVPALNCFVGRRMYSAMMTRTLALAALLTVGLAARPSAGADADKVREAANAFATACKMKDLDASMKLVDTPFLLDRGKKADLLDKPGGVKAGLKELFDRAEADRVPTSISRLIPREQTREAFPGRVRGLDLIEKALGTNGFLVVMTLPRAKEQLGFVVLVAPRGKEMKVVGLVD